MPQRVLRERAHVLGGRVVPPAQQCERPCRLRDADRPARAGPVRDVVAEVGEAHLRGRARRRCKPDRVADERRVDVDVDRRRLECLQVLERERLTQLGLRDELPLDDGQLLVVLRIVDEDLQHEPVDLRLRQRVGALGLDRVLRRHDEKRLRHRIGRVRDRHLPLLHHLEQRRLHLRRRTVDLVGEQEVAEDGAELGVERPLVGPVDPRADEVGGHEIGCELDAREAAAEHAGGGLDRQRLGEAGNALDQEVALREEADEHPLQHRVLPGDDAPDLEKGLLQPLADLGRRQRRSVRLLGHEDLP